MKRFFASILTGSLGLLSLSAVLVSCDKTIDEAQPLAYTPASVDEHAGTWKTYVLTSPADVTLAAPTATTSSAYQAELSSLKEQSTALSAEQQQAVVYWG
ncbi:MAG: PA-phosphatase, partial [Cytophagaceae bacterium]